VDLRHVLLVVSEVVGAAFLLLTLFTALVVVPKDRRPSSATAWIITIVFVPVVGIVAFFLIGNPHLPRARRVKQRSIDRLITERTRGYDLDLEDLSPGPRWLDHVVRLNQNLGALPMVTGNEAVVQTGTRRRSAPWRRRRRRAGVGPRRVLHPRPRPTTAPFFDAMQRAVERGVVVRVLLDHIGSWGSPGHRRTLRQLDRTGVHWRLMLPVQPLRGRYQRPDLRNHRKLVVVDGRTGWAGSQNLVDRSYNKRVNRRRGLQWQDLMVRLRGPRCRSWTRCSSPTGSPRPTSCSASRPGTRPTGRSGTSRCRSSPAVRASTRRTTCGCSRRLLYGAQDRVSITSPYFVPDESLLYAVTSAGYRGVAVELFVPEQADQFVVHHAQRSYYEQLLRAGVRIWLYPRPYVLHAKHVSVDSEIAVVGSSNLDIRSFTLDLELTLLVHGRSFARQVQAVEDGYRAVSRELVLDAWLARPRWERVVDNLARLTSSLQ
jgi:cardiolipin synthase